MSYNNGKYIVKQGGGWALSSLWVDSTISLWTQQMQQPLKYLEFHCL